MTAVLRYEICVDDQAHPLLVHGPIVHVATRHIDRVEFWAHDTNDHTIHDYRVFGTGQPVLAGWEYVGTAIVPGGQLVWHLFSHDWQRS